MILLSSQISFYYNLRNLCLVLGLIFVLAGLGYGAHVHMIIIVQKYFGIEKRREIAKRRAAGYTGRSNTAKIHAQHTAGRSGGMSPAEKIDVSHVRTEKMKLSGRMAAAPGSAGVLSAEGTEVLSQNRETMVLSEGETTMLPEPGTGVLSEPEITMLSEMGTEVLSEPGNTMLSEMGAEVLSRNRETMVLPEGGTTMLPEPEMRVLSAEGSILPLEPGTAVLTQEGETVVLSKEEKITGVPQNGETVVLSMEGGTVGFAPPKRAVIFDKQEIIVVHGEDIC